MNTDLRQADLTEADLGSSQLLRVEFTWARVLAYQLPSSNYKTSCPPSRTTPASSVTAVRTKGFAAKLYHDLRGKGVRCWFAPEDLKTGDLFRQSIHESILRNDKLLPVLSEHSVNSAWVQDEVEAALEREHREGRTVLLPIRIDNVVMQTDKAWAASIRRTRHIGDFSNLTLPSYQAAFHRLLRDLKAEVGKESTGQA
jgi:TIR domain